MKKKKALTLVIGILLIAVIGGIVVKINSDRQVGNENEQLETAYQAQNAAFYIGNLKTYAPLKYDETAEDGVSYVLYLDIACYRKLTGEALTFDEVKDYLSQEYEDDGEVRIYTNGLHPEIAKYVEWFSESEDSRRAYRFTLTGICNDYYKDRGIAVDYEKPFANRAIMDEVIKKEADPDYEMNEEIMLSGLSV